MASTDQWLRLDESTNALDNLEMCSYFLRNLPNPIRWKWAIIAIQQALYGFAVAAVQGTDQGSVRKRPEDPESRLISIWEALKRAGDPANLWPGTTPLMMSPAEEKALQRVVSEFRNGFEHFGAQSWSIEVAGLPALLAHVLAVVQRIALKAQSPHRYEDGDLERLRVALASAATELGVVLPAA
jgi:hypothetical protein